MPSNFRKIKKSWIELFMIQSRIIEYQTLLDKENVEQFLNYGKVQISEEQWLALKTRVQAFEIKLCNLFRRIFSLATVEVFFDSAPSNANDFLQSLMEKNIISGPLLEVVEVKEKSIVYKAGEKLTDKAFVLVFLLFIYDSVLSSSREEEQNLEDILIENLHKYLSYVKYDSSFVFKKILPVVSDKEIEAMFSSEVFQENKNMLLLLRDGVETVLQKYSQNSFFLQGEGEFYIYENLYVEQIENYIKKQIKQSLLPGNFVEIKSITLLDGGKYRIVYVFGPKIEKTQSDLEPAKAFIKECLLVIFYQGSSSAFFRKLNTMLWEDFYEQQ